MNGNLLRIELGFYTMILLTFFFTGGAVSTYIAIKNIVYDENGIQVGQCYLGGDSEISAGSGGH